MVPREEFKRILDETDYVGGINGDPVFLGLCIIEKYMPNKELIGAAEHDIIYSVDIDELLDAGITYPDVKELARLNWHVADDYYLAHYV